MTGGLGPGSTLEAPGEVRCVYAAPIPQGVDVATRGLHGTTKNMSLTSMKRVRLFWRDLRRLWAVRC